MSEHTKPILQLTSSENRYAGGVLKRFQYNVYNKFKVAINVLSNSYASQSSNNFHDTVFPRNFPELYSFIMV
mgnify:CR=1 FL=1